MGAFKDMTCQDTPPFDVTRELVDHVKNFAAWSPRSRQTQIGVSEIGHPCARRLAYKVLAVERTNTDSDSWPAIVGTSVHTYLEKAFKKDPDYLTEVKVLLEPWTKGTADLVHIPSKTVIDHKVVGVTALKAAKANGMTEQYRVQLNMYATGLRLAGIEIDNIAIMFWSRSGMFRDAYSITEPYDEALVDKSLERYDAIKAASAVGVQVLPLIPATPSNCMYCPYFFPLSNDMTESCNGVKTVDPTQPNKVER
jgi:CRISPR/Cas system-associated exonuclease Cas4 (RecB family)